MAKPVLVSTKALVRVPRQDLWDFLADTDRLNREVGLSPVQFAPVLDPGRKGHFAAVARAYGRPLRYEEFPFEWVAGRYYRVLRRFPSGPIAELVTGIRIGAEADGTELEVFSSILPRNIFGMLAARTLLTRRSSRTTLALARALEQHAMDPAAHPLPALPPADSVNLAVLARRIAEVSAPRELVDRLDVFLRTASDQDVTSIRPFDLADRWAADRMQVLHMLLRAAERGLLDLNWSLLCPVCRSERAGTDRLQRLASRVHCDTCDIEVDADLAGSVEVRFGVNPAVRRAERSRYCIGGPAHTPSVVAQIRLEPGERRVERLDVSGALRVRCYQVGRPVPIDIGEGAVVEISCFPSEFAVRTASSSTGSRVEVTNSRTEEALVVLERQQWRDRAATAALVTSLQDFKDLFPGQGVSPGDEVGIANLVVLFTDLGGSTAMYERLGDVAAFAFVQSHFRYLCVAVVEHNGAVVKKMGDAVMATFADPVDAWSAARAMQSGWDEFRSEHSDEGDDVTLKIGMHQGPAVMIDNDGSVDYFGATVNLAARIQGCSVGADIVVSEAIHDDPDVAALVGDYRCDPFTVSLKGIHAEQTLFRFTLAPESSGTSPGE